MSKGSSPLGQATAATAEQLFPRHGDDQGGISDGDSRDGQDKLATTADTRSATKNARKRASQGADDARSGMSATLEAKSTGLDRAERLKRRGTNIEENTVVAETPQRGQRSGRVSGTKQGDRSSAARSGESMSSMGRHAN